MTLETPKHSEEAFVHPLADDPRETLSPSALSSFEICGKRGQFYKDPNLARVNTMSTARGRAWHTAMETYNVRPALYEDGGPDFIAYVLANAALESLAQQVSEDDFEWQEGDDFDAVVAELDVMCRSFADAPPQTRWYEPEIWRVGIEVSVLADFGSPTHIMPGVIDAVMAVNGTHIGVDYKSAGRAWGGAKAMGDPRKLIQPPLYAEAWEQTRSTPMDWFCMDVMTVKGRFERIWVPTHKAVREPLLGRWRDVATQVALYAEKGLDMPTNPGHILCSEKWCGFWSICPMGQEYETILHPVTGTRVPVAIGATT